MEAYTMGYKYRIYPNKTQGGKKHYIMTKAWQRSSVGHLVKSRCRHAKRKTVCGYRYKGGR